MNLEKYFNDIFGMRCIVTDHALKRITTRLMASELNMLKLMIQGAMRSKPIEQWKTETNTAIADPRYNMGMVVVPYQEEQIIKIITFIRGKEPNAYKDCELITASINKEKVEQEIDAIKKSKTMKKM